MRCLIFALGSPPIVDGGWTNQVRRLVPRLRSVSPRPGICRLSLKRPVGTPGQYTHKSPIVTSSADAASGYERRCIDQGAIYQAGMRQR